MPKKNQLKNGGPTHYEESQVEVVEKVINKDNESAKEYAYLKSKHVVDTKSTNKTFGTISFTMNDTNNNEYKMTNHVSEEDE